MKLFISGKGEGFSLNKVPPRVLVIKKLLDSSKDGELFKTFQLASITKRDFHNVQSEGTHYLKGYSYKIGNTRYWGKPATIKQLIKETKNGR